MIRAVSRLRLALTILNAALLVAATSAFHHTSSSSVPEAEVTSSGKLFINGRLQPNQQSSRGDVAERLLMRDFEDRTAGKVFSKGQFRVKQFPMPGRPFPGTAKSLLPPKPLIVLVPRAPGRAMLSAPVLQFQHGFASKNRFYSSMLRRIASHGFIVVAPQMYRLISGFNATPEIRSALETTQWLQQHLPRLLSRRLLSATTPDWSRFAVSGHSRGGKVAYSMALGLVGDSSVPIKALIGFDPVDGGPQNTTSMQSTPQVLKHEPNSLTFTMPQLVIGAAKSGSCAPTFNGPKYFFSDSAGPATLFTATEYGHGDFMNTLIGTVTKLVCQSGRKLERMRAASAGLTVAFLNAVLRNNTADFEQIYGNPQLSPAKLAAPQSYPLPPPW